MLFVCDLESLYKKSFICERCDYFKTFLHDPFNELTNANESALTTVHLKDVSKEVFAEIVYFIYSNEFSTPNVLFSFLICKLIQFIYFSGFVLVRRDRFIRCNVGGGHLFAAKFEAQMCIGIDQKPFEQRERVRFAANIPRLWLEKVGICLHFFSGCSHIRRK